MPEHDYRCMGECVRCHGAGACSMVGDACIPCGGQCAKSPLAITESMIDAFCETYNRISGRVPQRMYVPLALEAALKAKETW